MTQGILKIKAEINKLKKEKRCRNDSYFKSCLFEKTCKRRKYIQTKLQTLGVIKDMITDRGGRKCMRVHDLQFYGKM